MTTLTGSEISITEREMFLYWLLRAYQSGHREGWEHGPSTDETMDGICSVLANAGYDPNLSEAAKELLSRRPVYTTFNSRSKVSEEEQGEEALALIQKDINDMAELPDQEPEVDALKRWLS